MRVATRPVVLPLPRKSSQSLRDASAILGLARQRDETSHEWTSSLADKTGTERPSLMSGVEDIA